MQESEYPLVSICMPVYNGARFLPYTIDNILAQLNFTYSSLLFQPNEGAFSARNRALKESTGEYIMFMDCDDFISHHKVQRQIEILRENDPYTIVSCKWDTFYLNIEESTFPKRCVYKNYHTPIDMLIEQG